MSEQIKKKSDLAVDYFMKGYNCSQSVVAAFAPELGISESLALRLSSGFGAGVGRMREVCGAFNGLTAVIGMAYANPSDPADKSNVYAIVQQFATEFKMQNGGNSVICKELLGLACVDGSAQAEARTETYYKKRPCKELVRLAAALVAGYMEQNPYTVMV
ncbi:MAG: C-GCAxxG-C-C family protein [Faecalibacterium sp.]